MNNYIVYTYKYYTLLSNNVQKYYNELHEYMLNKFIKKQNLISNTYCNYPVNPIVLIEKENTIDEMCDIYDYHFEI